MNTSSGVGWRSAPYIVILLLAGLATCGVQEAVKREKTSTIREATETAQTAVSELRAKISSAVGSEEARAAKLAALIAEEDKNGASLERLSVVTRGSIKDDEIQSTWYYLNEASYGGVRGARFWREKKEKGSIKAFGGAAFTAGLKGESWFESLSKSKGPQIEQGKDFITSRTPIIRQGKFIGAVGMSVEGTALHNVLSADNGRVAVFSPAGRIAFASSEKDLGKRATDIKPQALADAFELCLADTAATAFSAELAQGEVIVASQTFDTTEEGQSWVIVSTWPLAPPYLGRWRWAAICTTWLLAFILILALNMKRQSQQVNRLVLSSTGSFLTAEAFRKLERQRAICILLSAIFFFPALFIMSGAQEKYMKARGGGYPGTAKEAVIHMQIITACAVIIGGITIFHMFWG